MAQLALVYGVRLLPSDELESFEGGSEEEIKRQLITSLDAFFDFYPEI